MKPPNPEEVTMDQPSLPSVQPAGPLRPDPPAPVLGAVKLMHAGAAVSGVCLIITLALVIGDITAAAHLQWRGHILTAAQLSPLRPVIATVVMAAGLVVIALWLWMARATGRGRNWARVLSTVLFGLATLQLISVVQQPVSQAGVGVTLLSLLGTVLTWLPGLGAVWLLWRPASSAFFGPQGLTRAGHRAQPSSRIGSSS